MAHFFLINLAKVVDGDNVVSLENFAWLIKFLRNNFTVFDFVRSTERRVNEAFAIGKSQSAVMKIIT